MKYLTLRFAASASFIDSGRGKLMLRSTPRIEVNQRSHEARLRLERVERLIVVVITRRSSLVATTSGLAAKLRRVLSRSGLVLTALTDLAQ